MYTSVTASNLHVQEYILVHFLKDWNSNRYLFKSKHVQAYTEVSFIFILYSNEEKILDEAF